MIWWKTGEFARIRARMRTLNRILGGSFRSGVEDDSRV